MIGRRISVMASTNHINTPTTSLAATASDVPTEAAAAMSTQERQLPVRPAAGGLQFAPEGEANVQYGTEPAVYNFNGQPGTADSEAAREWQEQNEESSESIHYNKSTDQKAEQQDESESEDDDDINIILDAEQEQEHADASESSTKYDGIAASEAALPTANFHDDSPDNTSEVNSAESLNVNKHAETHADDDDEAADDGEEDEDEDEDEGGESEDEGEEVSASFVTATQPGQKVSRGGYTIELKGNNKFSIRGSDNNTIGGDPRKLADAFSQTGNLHPARVKKPTTATSELSTAKKPKRKRETQYTASEKGTGVDQMFGTGPKKVKQVHDAKE